MKTFAKLFVLALALALIGSLLTIGASATNTQPGADPNALKPGSEQVIFIKDAPRDEYDVVSGKLDGDGTGSDAQNPLLATEHEKFDPSAERKRYDYTTAFYQATEMLAETGGTIVICGPVHLGVMECADNGATTVRDAYTAKFGNNVIKFTSVYNGVDYRETAGAKLTIKTPAMVTVLGSSIWENIDIETDGTGRAITFDDYCTLIGEGVKCYPRDSAFDEVAQNYVSLGSGHRHAGSKNENPTLTVKSGTYNTITAAMWGTSATATSENTNATLTLEGTTKVMGVISGTVQAKSNFSGNVNITINGGTYECDINAVGPTGMMNTDGVVNIKINGGNFVNAWSINKAALGATNNMPAKVTLDFSSWTGDSLGLTFAYSLITDITDVILPANIPVCYLTLPAETTQATTPETTQPQVTTEETQTADSATDGNDSTKSPETNAAAITPDKADGSGGSPIAIIVIIVIAFVAIAAVAVVITKNKKK